jgi:hypothetical protein
MKNRSALNGRNRDVLRELVRAKCHDCIGSDRRVTIESSATSPKDARDEQETSKYESSGPTTISAMLTYLFGRISNVARSRPPVDLDFHAGH